MELAKKHYPESPLAQISNWKAPVQRGRVKIKVARHCTHRLRQGLWPYVSGMQKLWKKPKPVGVIKKALWGRSVDMGQSGHARELAQGHGGHKLDGGRHATATDNFYICSTILRLQPRGS